MTVSNGIVPNRQPKAIDTILLGGLLAGLLDGTDAVVFYGLAMGVNVGLLFQNIAGGVLGSGTFQYGWVSVVLGVALHFLIATGAATVYYGLCRWRPVLLRYPFVTGPVFGLGVYVVMHYVVVPLSAVSPRTVPVTPAELLDQLVSHMFFVGLPVALLARRSASRQ